jgi:hypothetical protein
MRCAECKGPLVEATRSWGYPHLGEEVVAAQACEKCGESYLYGPDVESAEERIAIRLMKDKRRDGRAIRFMTTVFGVFIDEYVLRFDVKREVVKSWRNSDVPLTSEIVAWAYSIVEAGGLPDGCRCGECG